MKTRKMRTEDIEDYINCQARIWETLREYLPGEVGESNLNWMKRQGARDA